MTDAEFTALLDEHRTAAERYVRYRVYSGADADDILAETYEAAWLKRDQLRDVSSFRAWLIGIARSKCADRMCAAQKRSEREEPSPDIGDRVSVGGGGAYTAVSETMMLLPIDKRRLLYMTYWQQLPQKEIAEHLGIPIGTVKSRLSAAKSAFRDAYTGYIPENREVNMDKHMLPEILPEYTITYTGEPFPVVCEELMGWFAVPRDGEKLSWAMYDLPSRRRDIVYRIEAGGPVEMHGISGIELTAKGCISDNYTALMSEPIGASGAASDEWRFAALLTDTHSRFLAAAHREDGIMKYRTFLDGDAFLDNWGFGDDNCGFETHIAPKGDIVRNGNTVTAADKDFLIDVVGRYDVEIGGRKFDTVCLMDVGTYVGDIVAEQFIGRDGRTVLWRRFNSDEWHMQKYGSRWTELLPENERIYVNGKIYVHWYDCLTDRIF